MKNLLAGAFLLGTIAFANAQSITFNETTVDYGTIKAAADGNREFIVKNTGNKPLIISKVQPSCGCTTPEFSQTPILPGKTGKIKVHYDTNRIGDFQKLIEVYSNDPVNSRSVIYIKGKVEANTSETNTTSQTVANDMKHAAKVTGDAISKGVKKGLNAVKKGYESVKEDIKK